MTAKGTVGAPTCYQVRQGQGQGQGQGHLLVFALKALFDPLPLPTHWTLMKMPPKTHFLTNEPDEKI
jgi:hypothetical protein